MNCTRCDSPIPPDSKFCLECGTDLSDPGGGPRTAEMPPDLEVRLKQTLEGRYQVERALGRGGMGAVFLAEDLTLERPVAIKVLPPEMSFDKNLVARFEREARTAAKLDHPNIIPIFAVESAEDLHYFVMKYVAGQSLESVLANGSLSIELCQEYLWEMARALGHAHQRGVVHRDVKPANIMLDHDGRVMLADFGISKAMQSATQYTGTGQVIGTPYYMSPEQAKGASVDGRSDQYSLALVGYQMLTGRLPFEEGAVHAIIYKHIFEEPAPIRGLRPDVPPFLAAALHKALAKTPEERFASMEDFAEAVLPERRISATFSGASAAAGANPSSPDAPTTITPTTAPTYITPSREPRAGKRRGAMAAAVVAALFVLVGGSGYWAWEQDLWAGFGQPGGPDLGAASVPTVPPGGAVVAATPAASGTQADSTPGAAVQGESAGPAESMDDAIPRQPARSTRPRPRRTPPAPAPAPAAAGMRTAGEGAGAGAGGPPSRRASTPGPGSLTVAAEPWGAVWVDGVEVTDQTPLVNYPLAPGSHEIRVVRDGCRTAVDTVTVSAGRPTRLRKNLICVG